MTDCAICAQPFPASELKSYLGMKACATCLIDWNGDDDWAEHKGAVLSAPGAAYGYRALLGKTAGVDYVQLLYRDASGVYAPLSSKDN